MLGGISDVLTIGYDMAGDDKACLTVARKIKPRSYQVINQFFDKDAEEIYERLTEKVGENNESS